MIVKEFTTISGRTLEVDTSNEACQKFGFDASQRITDIHGNPGTVVGVTSPLRSKDSQLYLWVTLDKHNGRIIFSSDPAEQLRKC